MILRALASRVAWSTPCTSRGKATLPSTVRWGSRAKCWNTMPILWRRISIIRSAAGREQEILAVEQDLAGGRLDQRDMQRTRVDLPDPERPMMTKISPSRTLRLTSRTAPIRPRLRIGSSLGLMAVTYRPEKRSPRPVPNRLPDRLCIAACIRRSAFSLWSPDRSCGSSARSIIA